jgi:preprotein translocase subunit SecE
MFPMASVTNDRDEKTMATDLTAPGAGEPESNQPRERVERSDGGGFFTIYKKGQGYWTRICTAAATILLLLLTVRFLWLQVPYIAPWFMPASPTADQLTRGNQIAARVMLGVCAVAGGAIAWLCWSLMNRPSNVDFLIATDSEMKKVNWTSKKELIGSTKVVIFFMFLIAIVLFVLDMYFTRVFYLAGVLVADSPLWDFAGSLFVGKDRMPTAASKAVKGILDVIMGIIVFGGAAWAVYGASKTR